MKLFFSMIVALLLSTQASAALISKDFSYSLGYLDEQTNYEYEFWTSGVASIFYEEGSTELSSILLYGANNELLFSSLTSTDLVFVNSRCCRGEPLTYWDDGSATSSITMDDANGDGTAGLRFTRDLVALSSVAKVVATVDDWTGVGHGVFSQDGRIAMFDTSGIAQTQSTKVSAVPEPSSLILLTSCLLGLLAPMRRRFDA